MHFLSNKVLVLALLLRCSIGSCMRVPELITTLCNDNEYQENETDAVVKEFCTKVQGPMFWEYWSLLYLASEDSKSIWFRLPKELLNYIPWVHGVITLNKYYEPENVRLIGKTIKVNSCIAVTQINGIHANMGNLVEWLDCLLSCRQQLYALKNVNLGVSPEKRFFKFLSSSDSLQIVELTVWSNYNGVCNDIISSLASRSHSLHELSVIITTYNFPLSIPQGFAKKNNRLVKFYLDCLGHDTTDDVTGLVAFSGQLYQFTRLKDLKMPAPHSDAIINLSNFVAESKMLRYLNVTNVVADQTSIDQFINALNTSSSIQTLSFRTAMIDVGIILFEGLTKLCKLSFLDFGSAGTFNTPVDSRLLESIESFLQSNENLTELRLMFPQQYFTKNLFSLNIKAPIISLALNIHSIIPHSLISAKDLPLLERLLIITLCDSTDESRNYIMEWLKSDAWFDPACKLQSMHLHVFHGRFDDMDDLQELWTKNEKKLTFY